MENEIFQLTEMLIADEHFAVGNDLVFIPDFKKSFNYDFKRKVYTENEISYCNQFDNSLLRYASTWAAKEAVYKALKQVDPSAVSWKKIEIIRKKVAGKPDVILHTENKHRISLSLSHDADYVWAIALLKTSF